LRLQQLELKILLIVYRRTAYSKSIGLLELKSNLTVIYHLLASLSVNLPQLKLA